MNRIFSLLVILLFTGCNYQSELANLRSETELLTAENERLINRLNEFEVMIDSLQKHNKQLQEESNAWFNPKTDGKHFLEKGIENPEEYITNAFRQKKELIPVKPVLGGQMQFRQVKLLGKGCLIAYYEDGHRNGKALYSYSSKDGGLYFKLIRTCAD